MISTKLCQSIKQKTDTSSKSETKSAAKKRKQDPMQMNIQAETIHTLQVILLKNIYGEILCYKIVFSLRKQNFGRGKFKWEIC